MTNKLDALHMSLSAHFAALVSAIDQENPGVKDRFLSEINKRRDELKDMDDENTVVSEGLYWTSTLLKK